jgi:phage gp29-like protein
MKINDIINESKPGLWANIHAKQERIKHGSGEHMRKPGSKGAPTAQNFKDAASESVEEGAPELLKAEMPLVRAIEQSLAKHGYEKGTEEYKKVFDHMLSFHRKFGNADRINK